MSTGVVLLPKIIESLGSLYYVSEPFFCRAKRIKKVQENSIPFRLPTSREVSWSLNAAFLVTQLTSSFLKKLSFLEKYDLELFITTAALSIIRKGWDIAYFESKNLIPLSEISLNGIMNVVELACLIYFRSVDIKCQNIPFLSKIWGFSPIDTKVYKWEFRMIMVSYIMFGVMLAFDKRIERIRKKIVPECRKFRNAQALARDFSDILGTVHKRTIEEKNRKIIGQKETAEQELKGLNDTLASQKETAKNQIEAKNKIIKQLRDEVRQLRGDTSSTPDTPPGTPSQGNPKEVPKTAKK